MKRPFHKKVGYEGSKGFALSAGIDRLKGTRKIRERALQAMAEIAIGSGLIGAKLQGGRKGIIIGTVVGGVAGFLAALPEFKEVRQATRYVGHLMTKEADGNLQLKEFLEKNKGKYLIIDGKGNIILTNTRNPFGRMRLSINKILEGAYKLTDK